MKTGKKEPLGGGTQVEDHITGEPYHR